MVAGQVVLTKVYLFMVLQK